MKINRNGKIKIFLTFIFMMIWLGIPAFAREKDIETLDREKPEAAAESLSWNPDWTYASNSEIHDSDVTLYHAADPSGIVICVNAGHGTAGGDQVSTLSHPDGTPKVTGGTNAEGAVWSMSISSGMDFLDGTAERDANLQMALILKEKLLLAGYDVLMIRETEDVRLDNIARSCFANAYADAHLALHYDSTDFDKGFYYMGVPSVDSYRSMYPVSEYWPWHESLGQALVSAVGRNGLKVFESGRLEMDLTQTSYSTTPSVDIELGDKASDHSRAAQEVLADALVEGLDDFFADRR